MNSNWIYSPETLNSGQNRRFFVLCDHEIWWMTLENNRAALLYYIKLCASFQIHWWIQTEVTARKRSIRVKIGNFLSCVTLKFDGWPWKQQGTSSLLHEALFIISNPLLNSNWSYSPETPNLVQIRRFLEPCGLEIWRITLKNNMLLQALCIISQPSVNSNWSYSPETPNFGQNRQFYSRVTLKFSGWPSKTIRHLFYAT